MWQWLPFTIVNGSQSHILNGIPLLFVLVTEIFIRLEFKQTTLIVEAALTFSFLHPVSTLNKGPQAKSPSTYEMLVSGEYVYNMYVKKAIRGYGKSPLPHKAPPLFKYSMDPFKKPGALQNTYNEYTVIF